MTIQDLINKYNDATTGLFKNNAPAKGINAATLRGFVDDIAGVFRDFTLNTPFTLRTDWVNGLAFPTLVSGGGAATLVDSQPGYPGLLNIATAVAGGGGHVISNSRLLPLDKSMLLQARLFFPALSTGPDSFYHRYGLIADSTIRAQVDGVYFEYSHDVNGGQWTLNAYKAGVLTQVLTTVPVAINTAYVLGILLRPGNGAVFTINGASVGFIAEANLPVVACLYANGIRKYNGAASRSVMIDSDVLVINLPI